MFPIPWSGRARGAADLAALAILSEPEEYFSEPTDVTRLLKISERYIKRYLNTAVGDHSFGTEGDLYTIQPWILVLLPFYQAYENVVGQDLVTDSSVRMVFISLCDADSRRKGRDILS